MASLSAEFPNDNPVLHRGVSWVCLEPTGDVQAQHFTSVITPGEHRDEDDDAGSIVVEELEPIEASLEGSFIREEPANEVVGPPVSQVVLLAPAGPDSECSQRSDESELVASPSSRVLPLPPDDAFTILVSTLADVAIHAGSPHAAALVRALLFDARLPEPFDGAAAEALRSRGILEGTQIAPAFVATTCAWRAILTGTSDDFSACGTAMLDEWTSDLLATLLDAPTKLPALRQELRRRGVAAFGLVEAAA